MVLKKISLQGKEYISSLCCDIGQEYNEKLDSDSPTNDLIDLVKIIVPYLIKQHCENDEID